MPSKGTKARAVRGVPDDKWAAFQAWARRRGTNASDVLRRHIDSCLAEPEEQQQPEAVCTCQPDYESAAWQNNFAPSVAAPLTLNTGCPTHGAKP